MVNPVAWTQAGNNSVLAGAAQGINAIRGGQEDRRLQVASDLDKRKKDLENELGVKWQNLVEASYAISGAFAIGNEDIEAQNKLLTQAKDIMATTPDHPIAKGMDHLMSLPKGKERDALFIQTIDWLTDQGVFGKEAAKTGGKTPEQIEREIVAKEMQAEAAIKNTELRETEAENEMERFTEKRGDVPAYIQKPLDDAQTAAFESERAVGEYETLATDMDALAAQDAKGGLVRKTSEYFKDLLGTQEETSLLYKRFRRMRGSFAMKNLPPGAASDADVAIAMQGVPQENAGPKHISSWLRGVAKMEKVNQTYFEAKSRYISANPRKGTVGFRKYWSENRDELLADAFNVSLEEITSKGGGLGGALKNKTVVRRGKHPDNGRPVVEYSDGTIDYAD